MVHVNCEYMPLRVASAVTQMAIDYEMAQSCAAASRRAMFRLYRMDPPAVTIGRNQRWRDVIDPQECRRRGWEWARRPTGGGALLHRAEINYALAASRDVFEGRDTLRAAFAQIMSVWKSALESLGLRPAMNLGRTGDSSAAPSPAQRQAHGLCQQSLTRYEITIDGKKAVAAAQWHLPTAILQHGTIYLCAPKLIDRFWPRHEAINTVAEPTPNWWDLSQIATDPDAAVACLTPALRDGFAQVFDLRWQADKPNSITSDRIGQRLVDWQTANWKRRR